MAVTLQQIVDILSKPGVKSKGCHIDAIINTLNGGVLFSGCDEALLRNEVLSLIKKECANPDGVLDKVKVKGRLKRDWYKIRRMAVSLPKPAKVEHGDSDDTLFIGKGGEFAVMSELLFKGYNANIMTVDEGIDIVASKDNIFYYIQVKTTHLKEDHTAIVQIKKAAFNTVSSKNVRYIAVVRCGSGDMRYFIFNQQNIAMYSQMRCLKVTDDNIIIKIRFNEADHKPYLYDGNCTQDVSFFQGNFEL